MKLLKTLPAAALALLAAFSPAFAQEAEKPSFKVTPGGLIMLDGAAYATNDPDFKAGVGIPDVRIGARLSYGSWKARADIGFAYNKAGLRDVYVEKTFNDNMSLCAGYFIHQFGLQTSTNSAMKVTMEEPTSQEAFGNPRLLGVMYMFDKGDYYATASVHAETNAALLPSETLGKTGYGAMTRLAWRPFHSQGNMMQVGFSAAGASNQYNADDERNHRSYDIGANFPTRVARVSAVGAEVNNAAGMFKCTPELLLCRNNFALESQYYYFRVNRKDNLSAYQAYGAYATVRWLAIGGNYSYDSRVAGIAAPAPKSLEVVAGYNYTSLSDKSAGILGGRVNDVSLTANWYINRFMVWRLRASYTHRFDRTGMPDANLGALQTRFQVIF